MCGMPKGEGGGYLVFDAVSCQVYFAQLKFGVAFETVGKVQERFTRGPNIFQYKLCQTAVKAEHVWRPN